MGEIADIIGGGTPSTTIEEYWNGEIDWYSPAEIGKQIFVSGSQKKITQLGLEKSSAKILPIGTVLFTSRAGIGNTAVLAKEGATNQGFQSILPKNDILDSYFIFSKTHELKRYGEVTGAGSTFIEVSGKQMSQMPLFIPNIQEQKKISAFFRQLDETISLHQDAIQHQQDLKKGMLQKLFPTNGAQIPSIRFASFTDDWEGYELGDLTERFDNLRIPVSASERIKGITPYYGANGIQDYVDGYTHEGEYILIAEDGANDLRNYPVQYVSGKVWVNNHAHVLQAKKSISDNMYLMSYIKQMNIEPFLVGGGRAKLNADIMMKLAIKTPSLQEQTKIGSFFKQIDDTIALQEQALSKLQQLKQSLLQKMFVN